MAIATNRGLSRASSTGVIIGRDLISTEWESTSLLASRRTSPKLPSAGGAWRALGPPRSIKAALMGRLWGGTHSP
jgi:hypothetical protein